MRGLLSKRDTWMTIGVVGAFLVAFAALMLDVLPPLIREDPCPVGHFLQIMDMEADATLEGNVDKAVSLYAPDGVVRDAGAGTSSVGADEIRDRYSNLPEFSKLRHVDVTVTCDEGGELARARASTTGEMMEDGRMVPISSVDGEEWTFQKVGGSWKIVSFTYNTR